MVKNVRIASSQGVDVFAPDSSYHTFFSSPYPAHRSFSAVDIYQGIDFHSPAYSPVEGEVYSIREFKSPALGEALPDYLLLIKSGDYIVRIMHVCPSLEVGDRVDVGDLLGSFIPSGFFSYFVDPHIHLEVREMDDFVRARGGFVLCPEEPGSLGDRSFSFSGRVASSSKRNSVVELEGFNVVEVEGRKTLLDGFSSLGYCGVRGCFDPGSPVFLDGIQIGTVSHQGQYMSVFDAEDVRFSVGQTSLAGVSFMYGSCLVMLVPERYGSLSLDVGEKVVIGLEK